MIKCFFCDKELKPNDYKDYMCKVCPTLKKIPWKWDSMWKHPFIVRVRLAASCIFLGFDDLETIFEMQDNHVCLYSFSNVPNITHIPFPDAKDLLKLPIEQLKSKISMMKTFS